ncbi:hypothetical protein Fmac_001967 [Flemingia macrophylla]|uniref:Uncharacterized protein n=1 Tax=Flemingia macrophylla TaxID=520843 RepID=A0ABD1NIK4_9FABA
MRVSMERGINMAWFFFFFFLSFLFTFSYGRIPFHAHIDRTNPTSSFPEDPTSPSHPTTLFPRHPMPLSPHRCHYYKPQPRGKVRHIARGWTRFGRVQPNRHRPMPQAQPKHTPFVKRIRKFLNNL